jgi:WD40 repeat protein
MDEPGSDMGSGHEILSLEERFNPFPKREVQSFDNLLSPDKSLQAVFGEAGRITLRDSTKKQEMRTFIGHKDRVTCLVFAQDHRRVLSGSRDRTLRLWDIGTGRELRCFTGHKDRVQCVALSAHGKLALSGCADGTVRFWDTMMGTLLSSFQAAEGGAGREVVRVAFSDDSRWACSKSADGSKPARWWCLPLTSAQALTDTTAAIGVDGNCNTAYTVRALLQEKALHYQQSICDWSQVISLDKDNAMAYFRRGHLFAAMQKYGQAKADLDKAFQLDPKLSNKP